MIIFSDQIWGYSTASTSEAAYIIGGRHNQNRIAEFKNDSWRQMGTLAKKRSEHGSIQLGNEVMVIGGFFPDGRLVYCYDFFFDNLFFQ